MRATSKEPSGRAPRHYLTAVARREQLLSVAAGLVEQRGWQGLSMKGLAAAAGVSRQLVYEHFRGRERLAAALFAYKFEAYRRLRQEILAMPGSPVAKVRTGLRLFLSVPREDRTILRGLFSEAGPASTAIETLRGELKRDILAVWSPLVIALSGRSEREAGALVWVLINAIWALADSVEEGRVTIDEAADLAEEVVRGWLSQQACAERIAWPAD